MEVDKAYSAGCTALKGIQPKTEYQEDGIKWQLRQELQASRRCILADERGLGKTNRCTRWAGS